MKKVFSLLLLTVFCMYTYAQQLPVDSVKNKEYYLEKRNTQRTTGWIFFGFGSAGVIVGAIVASSSSQSYFSSDYDNTGEVIAFAGVLCMAASIPFFIASHHSNLKAMQLSVSPKMEKNDQIVQMYVGRYQPAISLKINLK
jgi:hypothetical protein